MHDVAIIGGGVIGLSLALELVREGVTVAVADQGPLGQEASWAGAGMLPPGNSQHAHTPEAQLRAGSHALWPDLSARLLEETGVDNGFRRTGGLAVRFAAADGLLEDEIEAWQTEQVQIEPLSATELRSREPGLAPGIFAGYFLPEMGQVRNPRHLKALMAGCSRRGVSLCSGTPAIGFDRLGEKIVSVRTAQGKLAAGQFVIASGAWSSRLLAEAGCPTEVFPVRGQMVLLSTDACPIRHIINVGSRYVVPRLDGRVLVGSTEEDAGFDKRNTAEAVAGLLEFGLNLVPGLCEAHLERCWAGLRPRTRDDLPLLGRIPQLENLYVAAGHFRSGLQMSPVTARLMCDLILGRLPSISLDPFAPDRFAREPRVARTPIAKAEYEEITGVAEVRRGS